MSTTQKLQDEIGRLQKALAERNTEIESLKVEKTKLTESVTKLETQIRELKTSDKGAEK